MGYYWYNINASSDAFPFMRGLAAAAQTLKSDNFFCLEQYQTVDSTVFTQPFWMRSYFRAFPWRRLTLMSERRVTVIGADKTNNTGLEWLSDFTKAEIKIKLQFADLPELDASQLPVLMGTSALIPNIYVQYIKRKMFLHVKLNIISYCTNRDVNCAFLTCKSVYCCNIYI